MPKFRPDRKISKRFRHFGKTFDELSDEERSEIRRGIEALQSDNAIASICMIAWNEEKNIVSALDSLSGQKCRYPIEILVVDNNSTDGTAAAIHGLGARYFSEPNQGYAWARQRGVIQARGKYILSADADTIYPEKWAEKLIETLEGKDVACAYSLHAFFRVDGDYSFGLLVYQWLKYIGILIKDLKRPHLNCGGAGMGFNKELANQIGGYDVNVKRGSDGTLAFELGKLGKIKMVKSSSGQIWTSMRRTELDGNLWTAFWRRFALQMRYFTHYFSKQTER